MLKSEKVEKIEEKQSPSGSSTTIEPVENLSFPLLLNRKKDKPRSGNEDSINYKLGVKKIYQCDECISKYLHYSALYSHKKSKHDSTPNYNLKKRSKNGLTRKLVLTKQKTDKKCTSSKLMMSYFFDPKKGGVTDLKQAVENSGNTFEIINALFASDRLNTNYPLFSKILEGSISIYN